MINRWFGFLPALAVLVAMGQAPAWAGHRHHGDCGCNECSSDCGGDCGSSECDSCGEVQDCGTVTKTVYEPQYTTEKRRCSFIVLPSTRSSGL